MILLPHAVRIFIAVEPVNLRKSFEGLSNEVRSVLLKNPLSGHLFLFLNRRRTQVKILIWTRGGYTVVHKRLERGRFSFVADIDPGATSIEMDARDLSGLLEGLEVSKARAASRWDPRYPAHVSGP
jgi:transposase